MAFFLKTFVSDTSLNVVQKQNETVSHYQSKVVRHFEREIKEDFVQLVANSHEMLVTCSVVGGACSIVQFLHDL